MQIKIGNAILEIAKGDITKEKVDAIVNAANRGYNLPAKYVIHTVGPVYSGREEDEKLLAACYKNSLKLAMQHGIKSIAFPAISTGIYGYPMEEAARVAIKAIADFLKESDGLDLVKLVLYSQEAYEIHKKVLEEMRNKNEI